MDGFTAAAGKQGPRGERTALLTTQTKDQLQLHKTTAQLHQPAVTSQLQNVIRLSLVLLPLLHILILNVFSSFPKCH